MAKPSMVSVEYGGWRATVYAEGGYDVHRWEGLELGWCLANHDADCPTEVDALAVVLLKAMGWERPAAAA